MEILLITTILHSRRGADKGTNEKMLLEVFLRPKEIPEMANGLRYFLKEVVSKTDIVGSEIDRAVIKWACEVVFDALLVITASHNRSDD